LSGHAEANIASAAARALGIFQQKNIRVSGGVPRIRMLLSGLHKLGTKIVCVTDGPKGAYFSDGKSAYFMPMYPDPKPPTNRTGAGDAFAATFVSYIALGYEPLEALRRAPINSAFVVQEIGAQKGLLSREKLEEHLANAPKDYAPRSL
jgi:sugar/nucleoside kinase (ribokinase family)